MSMTRKAFCAAATTGPLLFWLEGCGGGGDSAAPAPPPATAGACASRAISANHGHELTINRADLDATSNQTYSIRGSGTHDHALTLTVAQLQSLKAGNALDVVSAPGDVDGHSHVVTVSCS